MSIPALSPYTIKATPLAQKAVAAAAISGTYSQVGTSFADGIVMLIIISTLDQAVQISYNGVTDHMPIPAGAAVVLDFKSDGMVLGGNFGIFVKEIGNPTTGSLYVSSFTVG